MGRWASQDPGCSPLVPPPEAEPSAEEGASLRSAGHGLRAGAALPAMSWKRLLGHSLIVPRGDHWLWAQLVCLLFKEYKVSVLELTRWC